MDIYSQNLKGTLNICVSSVPRKIILPNLIEKFSKLFPDISFNISNDDSRTVIDSILVGETDFGIVGLKISNPKLIYTQIMDDHIVYVVNKDAYPDLKNYSVINIEDLSNDKIILREIGSGTRQIVEDELKRNNSLNVISNSVATIHDTNTILDLITKGVGSGFISQRMLNLSDFKDKVKILNIKNLYLNRKFYFVYNKNLQFSNINKIFKTSGKKKDSPLTLHFLEEFLTQVSSLSYEERIRDLEMNPDRADVIPLALQIYIKAMKWAKIHHILVPKVGLADGIVRQLYLVNSEQ